MANQNKVEFGLSNVHVGLYTVDGTSGEGILGAGEAIPGAVSLELDVNSNENPFYADNTVYYTTFSESGATGNLVMANFPDSFKEKYLGYKRLADGALARVKNPKPVPFWLSHEGEGDAKKRRYVLLNVTAGAIQRAYRTNTENVEVEVETLNVTLVGDNKTSIARLEYTDGDTGYDDALTAPTIAAEAPVSP